MASCYLCILLVILSLQNSFGYKPFHWNYKNIVVPSGSDGQITSNNLSPPPNLGQVVEITTQTSSSTLANSEDNSNNVSPTPSQPQTVTSTIQSIVSTTENSVDASANMTPPPIEVITIQSSSTSVGPETSSNVVPVTGGNSTESSENGSNSITIASNQPEAETTTQSPALQTNGSANMTPTPIQVVTMPSLPSSTGSENGSNVAPSTEEISTNSPAPVTEDIGGNDTQIPTTTAESTESNEQAVTLPEDSTINAENADSDQNLSGNSSVNHERNPNLYLKRFIQTYSKVIEKSLSTLKEFAEEVKTNETLKSAEEDSSNETVDLPIEHVTSAPINEVGHQDIHARKGSSSNSNHTKPVRLNQNGENLLNWILISKSRLKPKVKPPPHFVNISLAFDNIPDSYQEPIVVEIHPGKGNNSPTNETNPPEFTFRPPQVNSPTIDVDANVSTTQRDNSIDSRLFTPKQAPNQPGFNHLAAGHFYGPKIRSESLETSIKGPHFHNNIPLKRRKRSESNDVVKIRKGSRTKNSADCIAFGTPRSSTQSTTSTASSGINEDLQTLLRLLRNRGRSQTTRRSG